MNDTATTTTSATMSRPNMVMISILFGLLTMGGGFTLTPTKDAGCAPPTPPPASSVAAAYTNG